MTEEEKRKLQEIAEQIEKSKATMQGFHDQFFAFTTKFSRIAQTRYCAGNSCQQLLSFIDMMDEWQKDLKSISD